MAINFLSGISAAAHKGLADIVSNKRANRRESRENRRYQDNMMIRLGEAQQAREHQDKVFAYQQTRDSVRDKQWAEQMGLQEDELQFRKDAHSDDFSFRKERAGVADEQYDKDFTFRKERADVADKQQNRAFGENQRQFDESLAEQVARNKGAAQYRQDMIDLQKRQQALASANTDVERQKIQAEIHRIKAQIEYYKAQAENVGKPTSTGKRTAPTWTQGKEIAKTRAAELAREFTDIGKWDPFTPNSYKWSSTDENEMTQSRKLTEMGARQAEHLFERFNGDMDMVRQHLHTLFDEMLISEKFGAHMRRDILREHPDSTLSDQEKLDDARRHFVDGWMHQPAVEPVVPGGNMGDVETEETDTLRPGQPHPWNQ